MLAAAVVGFGAFSSPALASDSTCALHNDNGDPMNAFWSVSDHSITWFSQGYDFKCGGANNEDFRMYLTVQYKSNTGVWHDAECNDAFCLGYRPTSGGSNYYTGGTEHSGKVVSDGHVYNWSGLKESQNKFCSSAGSGSGPRFSDWRVKNLVQYAGPSPDQTWIIPGINIPAGTC